jgi:response regulator RpfG family c-di-GMP phosphodiesterase
VSEESSSPRPIFALSDAVGIVTSILKLAEDLNQYKDLDVLLDNLLSAARRLVNADAGAIYLVENERLGFSYVQNDTLFRSTNNKHVYTNASLPIDERSIVGYAALTGAPLAIDDAYELPESYPFHFNRSFDQKTGYRTRSILTLPLKSHQAKTIGVLQIINAKNEAGAVSVFSREAQTYLPLLANSAAVAIERSLMTRELILRMMRMAELRDPTETGGHVQRVGSYAAEIYQRWASVRGLPEQEIKHGRDLIRIAAMLHDVGKVGVSDTILKKKDRLTEEEFSIMKRHTLFGARLFAHSTSELDALSREIALNHHEKWDGTGYPGFGAELDAPGPAQPKKGEEIPIAARITALADVFDALCSKRSYKDPWPDERILEYIQAESGKHFDPDAVRAFLDIFDVVAAIREKFKEPATAA